MQLNLTVLKSLLLIIILGLNSCSSKKTSDTKAIAEEHNEAKFDITDAKDASFLTDAAEINLEEIELGLLAKKNGMMGDIQKLGSSIEEDHSKAFMLLKNLAQKKMISIPDSLTEKGKESYRNLMTQPGKDFDRAYAGLMVERHKKAIDTFELGAANAKDPDIKAWANSCLPFLRHHLDNAMECQLKSDKVTGNPY